MKKTWKAILLAAALSLAACGAADEDVDESREAEAAQPTEQAAEPEVSYEEEPIADAEEPTGAEPVTDDTAAAEDTEEEAVESYPAEAMGDGAYVDFDDMCFYVDGKKYVLGVNTLQDLIDDGVPFEENDLANAENNLNVNYESPAFHITLGKWAFAQVRTMNDGDSNSTNAACKLCSIYLPLDDMYVQDRLGFNFPLTLTMDELLAEAGEPDENDHYDSGSGFIKDSIEYTKPSEKYYGNSSFSFEFNNDELRYVSIYYKP